MHQGKLNEICSMLTITLLTFAALFIVLGIIVLVISYYDVIGVVHVI